MAEFEDGYEIIPSYRTFSKRELKQWGKRRGACIVQFPLIFDDVPVVFCEGCAVVHPDRSGFWLEDVGRGIPEEFLWIAVGKTS